MRRLSRQVASGLALAALAVGCGSAGERLTSRRAVSTAALPPGGDLPGRVHAIGDTVGLGGGSVAVVALEDNVDAGRLFAPPRGTRYVAVEVRGCAGPNEGGVNFRPEYFSMRLADHTEHDADRGVKKPALRPGTIPPGGCSDGWVSFVIPARATPTAVVYHGSNDVTWTGRTTDWPPQVNAFILSGGGTLGSIQVGMLRALFEADIRPEVLVGTSIGSVNAAFLAADPCPERVEALREVWHGVRSRDLFSLNPLRMVHAFRRRGSLFPSEKWRAFLAKNLPYDRIEDAAVPLRIIATDFEDGSPVVLDSGSVVDAVMASTALPGIFPPHRIGDHLYLDGALSEPVPLKPAVDAGADTLYVLAVSHASPTPDAQSPGAILRHSLTILLIPRVRLDALQLPDGCPDLKIVQIPSVGAQVALWDMSCQDDLMERSYEEAAEFLADRARSADGDGDDGTDVTTISEMSVEVDVRDAPAHETRPAEAR